MFWLEVYQLYLDALEQDPLPHLRKLGFPRTVRVPFRQGHVDVPVRTQPEGGEHCALRFTVFAASDEPEPGQINRWCWYGEDAKENRPVLGEGVLLDEVDRW